ncbi:MAG: STAS/SEC14 domain-containing protein [Flavobacteriales bacterium]|nr:STAS/SEC14 domain-containing protein [Flavobacteriales bacterium]
MSGSRVIELDFGTVELNEDGILRFNIASGSDTITLNQLQPLLEALISMADGKPRPFYCDNSDMKSLGYPERKFIGSNLHLFASASAVKENSPVIRFIGHTINHFFLPKVPMQMFDSERKAIAWLKSMG